MLAVFLVFQSDTKKWGVILLLVVLLILTLALYLRFVLNKVIYLMLNDAINLKLYVDMFRVQLRNPLRFLGQHIVSITNLSKVKWLI